MGQAFGISEDDVWAALVNHGLALSPQRPADHTLVAELFDEVDHDDVEAAALAAGDDLDEQTDAAHAALWQQLQSTEPVRAWAAARQAESLARQWPPPPGAARRPKL